MPNYGWCPEKNILVQEKICLLFVKATTVNKLALIRICFFSVRIGKVELKEIPASMDSVDVVYVVNAFVVVVLLVWNYCRIYRMTHCEFCCLDPRDKT